MLLQEVGMEVEKVTIMKIMVIFTVMAVVVEARLTFEQTAP